MTKTVQRTARTALLVLTLSLPAGCGLLDTQTPDVIDPGSLDSPQGAEARRLGALADFAFVVDGDGTQNEDGFILLTGLMSDEFIFATSPPTEQEIDTRSIATNNPSIETVYLNLHRARVASENAAAALSQFSDDGPDDPGIPEMLSLAGFTYVYFAEAFCSGVPYSRFSGDSLIFGQPETTNQALARALDRFDSALASPGIDASIAALAAIGRGRALLDSGDYLAAAAAVQGVPTDFVYVTEHSDSPLRLQNAIYVYSVGSLWSLSENEGGNGIAWQSADDPRVPFFDTGDVGLNGSTPQVNQLKYPAANSSVPVASGVEARLIEAEAQLLAGDTAAMIVALNDLRQNAITPALPALTGPSDLDEAADMLFSERAFWLFATAHRLGDMRRLARVYGRDPETVFPTGPYFQGTTAVGQYGVDVNFPIPRTELNNPNFQGCFDRAP